MEIPQLEAFLEAAGRGSFRRAAHALFLSQPSVSARVQALEDEVGAPLFHRTARGVRLTNLGQTFLPFAQRSIETLRRGQRGGGEREAGVGGSAKHGHGAGGGHLRAP